MRFLVKTFLAVLFLLFASGLQASDRYEYDPNGRLTKVTYADGSRTGFS